MVASQTIGIYFTFYLYYDIIQSIRNMQKLMDKHIYTEDRITHASRLSQKLQDEVNSLLGGISSDDCVTAAEDDDAIVDFHESKIISAAHYPEPRIIRHTHLTSQVSLYASVTEGVKGSRLFQLRIPLSPKLKRTISRYIYFLFKKFEY